MICSKLISLLGMIRKLHPAKGRAGSLRRHDDAARRQVRADQTARNGGLHAHHIFKDQLVAVHVDAGHEFAEDVLLLLLVPVDRRKAHGNHPFPKRFNTYFFSSSNAADR